MRRLIPLVALTAWFASAATAAALETRILEVRTVGPTVRVSIELRDLFSEKFRSLLESGQTLYVRVQTELWEDRPLWDKLVRPAIVSVFRIIREPNRAITVSDAVGVVASLPNLTTPVPLRVEASPADAVSDSAKYYFRLVATVGIIEATEAEETEAAVFGRDDSTISVARVGRLIFRTVVQMTDYLQSVSSEAKTRVMPGRDIKAGVRP